MTTLALVLAACWPTGWGRVLVEADPAGGDLAARYGIPVSPGLVSLAVAARRAADPGHVRLHTQQLSGEVPVVVGPARSDQARAALTAICTADGRGGVLGAFAGREDAVAVVDVGRMDVTNPMTPVLDAADVVLLVARPRADELTHVAAYTDAAGLDVGPRRGRTRLILMGPGYAVADVQREVGLPVAGTMPVDRHTGQALSGFGAAGFLGRSRLARAAGRLATELAADLLVTSRRASSEGETAGNAVAVSATGHGTRSLSISPGGEP